MKNKTDGTSDVCPSDVEELAKQWTELFNTEVLQYAKPNEASDGEVFANIYHSLAHSPLAATMIQLEHSHASALTSTDELESTSNSEDDWERVCRVSNASHVREIQRREYRQWIETVHEDSSSDAANKDMDGMKHHSQEINVSVGKIISKDLQNQKFHKILSVSYCYLGCKRFINSTKL